MSQIVSLKFSHTLFATNSLATNFNLESDKELPKWLVEFDNFGREDSKSDFPQSRPLTESLLHNRPKWFEELTQRRRLSDITAMEIDSSNKSDAFKTDLLVHEENDSSVILIDQPNSKEVKSLTKDSSKLPSQRYSFDRPVVLPLDLENDHHSNRSVLNNTTDTHYSLVKDANSLEEEIFQFSASKAVENLKIQETSDQLEECIIPEMPRGNELTLRLLQNWGDDKFIGMNGIEILDQWGKRPVMKHILVHDSTTNRYQSLPQLSRLVDNVYRTHDDKHIWQMDIHKSPLPVQVVLQFQEPTTVALIRIWNYNKSRIHSYRGVRYLQMMLNNQLIFSGEIAKSNGDLIGSVENFGDTILFTTNEAILEHISHYDTSFQELLNEQLLPLAL